jgi:hypothetical protein
MSILWVRHQLCGTSATVADHNVFKTKSCLRALSYLPWVSVTLAEWSDVANDYVQHVLGYNWHEFQYKIYVVPPGDLCSWGGMGWVGCKDDCRAWISGDLWMVSATVTTGTLNVNVC